MKQTGMFLYTDLEVMLAERNKIIHCFWPQSNGVKEFKMDGKVSVKA